MSYTQGFTAIAVRAASLRNGGYPFAVVIQDDQVKAYVVTASVWRQIEEDITDGKCSPGQMPLVTMSANFIDTADQMGWVIVGNTSHE